MKTPLTGKNGKVKLDSGILERYGEGFTEIDANKELALTPMPEDPAERLMQAGMKTGVDKYVLKKLKTMSLETTEK